jgi:tRNA G46 methylase TrmB
MVNERFPELARRALQTGGRVYLRTDNPEYFEQSKHVFGGSAHFRETDTPQELQGILTDFEREFHAKGVPTLRAAYDAV